MTLSETTNLIYLNCPNFNSWDNATDKNKKYESILYVIDEDMNVEAVMEYPILEETGQVGPMGLDIGPDGNLYVADNQFFNDLGHKSRVLRVLLEEDGMPTLDDDGAPIIEVVDRSRSGQRRALARRQPLCHRHVLHGTG